MPGAAFFDLDKTLWPCVGEKAFAHHQLVRGGISLKQFLKIISLQIQYDLHLIDGTETLKRKILLELFSGEFVAPCLKMYEQLFHDALSRMFFPDMLDQIDRHRQAGDRIVIVSATIDFIASPAAAFLKADDCYATVLETHQGLFSGNVLGAIPFGSAKAKIVRDYVERNGLEPRECYAYGDHWQDRHMLEAVGNPVVINPDSRLKRHAREKNWETRFCASPKLNGFGHAKRFIQRQMGKSI